MTISNLPENVLCVINDDQRLTALYENSDKSNRQIKELDIITSMVASDFKAKIALVSLVEDSIQWFQSRHGLDAQETPVQHSFCAYTIAAEKPRPFVVLDATKDERFANNPLVTGEPNIRFYAGIPLIVDNQKLGALCVIDDKPRDTVDPENMKRLEQYGQLVSSILSLQTDSNLKKILESQHRSEVQRHKLALKASNVAAWVWDLETDMVDCDPELRALFGIKHFDPLKASDIIGHIHSDDQERVSGELQETLIGDKDFESEFKVASASRWLLGQGGVLDRDENGKALTIAGVNIDVTEQKKSEEKTKLLLRELNHRVKNTLAMLQSIANQTLKNSRTPDDFKKAFSGRIRSLAAAHTLLSDKEWEPINLYKLLRDQVNVYVDDLDSQLVVKGDEATLGPEEALTLGMVLHELATNAAKYGAISVPGGYIEINVQNQAADKGRMLQLIWSERNGPKVTPPETTGFGSIMIKRSLDKIVGSKVDLQYLPEGVEAKIQLPLITHHNLFSIKN